MTRFLLIGYWLDLTKCTSRWAAFEVYRCLKLTQAKWNPRWSGCFWLRSLSLPSAFSVLRSTRKKMVSFFRLFVLHVFSTTSLQQKQHFPSQVLPPCQIFLSLTQNELKSVFSRNFIVYCSKIILLMLQTCGQIQGRRLFYIHWNQLRLRCFVECGIRSFVLDLLRTLTDLKEEKSSDLDF